MTTDSKYVTPFALELEPHVVYVIAETSYTVCKSDRLPSSRSVVRHATDHALVFRCLSFLHDGV